MGADFRWTVRLPSGASSMRGFLELGLTLTRRTTCTFMRTVGPESKVTVGSEQHRTARVSKRARRDSGPILRIRTFGYADLNQAAEPAPTFLSRTRPPSRAPRPFPFLIFWEIL